MAVQWALSIFGPPGVAAAIGITAIILVAGASGVFDQSEVNNDDYDDDGIYIPYVPPYAPNPNVNPEENSHPEIVVNPDPNAEKEKDKLQHALPFGFINIYETQKAGNDWDSEIEIPDDTKPPSSSFIVGAEAYDSDIGFIIAAVMAGILTFWLIREYSSGRRS